MTYVGFDYPLKTPSAVGSAAHSPFPWLTNFFSWLSGMFFLPVFDKGDASSDVLMFGSRMGYPRQIEYTVEPWGPLARRNAGQDGPTSDHLWVQMQLRFAT